MNNEKIITMRKYGDTYEIHIRHLYLEMYINGLYQGGIHVSRTGIYEWVMDIIQDWLDEPRYEDLF